MNSQVFREYDIRGIVADDFDDAFVVDLGRGYATLLHRAGKKTITLGRDCRLSSDRLRDALAEGLLAAGIDVVDIGVVPTPLLYFSMLSWKMDGGVMITGSHNAAEYNGFKLGVGPTTIHGAEIQRLREIIERRDFVTPGAMGSFSERAVIPDYNDFIMSQFKLKPGLKVVVDGGNGCGGVIAAPLMKRLGLDTIELYTEMDGRFPNHHPDPTVEENMRDLAAAVKKNGAQVGIAYDGDADRVGAIDEHGKIVWGDELMVVFARSILKERPGAAIIGDVKCSKRMYDDIARHGGRPIMWKTGHSLIKSKMKEEKAALAGEMSGHIFFADRYFGYDDAIYAAMRVYEIASKATVPLSHLLKDLPPSVSTPEIRVDCEEELKFKLVDETKARLKKLPFKTNDIDGVRVDFGDGWGLVRASNTQPVLVLRFEAPTQKRL